MVLLTRLDGTPIVVNDDHILFVESAPDTVLALTTGARLMVKEPLAEVMSRAAKYRREAHPGFEVKAAQEPVAEAQAPAAEEQPHG